MIKVKKMKKGIIYLVGAGPGDPELITVKAFNIIKKAEVIVYDSLIPFQLLKNAPVNAELIPAGKRAGNHILVQEKINSILLNKAKSGKIVVRLKGGDPFVFGRGGEEASFLIANGVEVRVVPGVSSSMAVALAAGIPLTQRNLATSIAIISGSDSVGEAPKNIPRADTVVFLMPKRNLRKIVDNLLEQGFKSDIDCALVENGTKPNQRVVRKKLGEFIDFADVGKIAGPAIFIVGETVALADTLSQIYQQYTENIEYNYARKKI